MTIYAVKVQNGVAKVYDAKTGSHVRLVGTNVVSAQITGDLVQVTDKSGSVKLYDARTGAYKRTL